MTSNEAECRDQQHLTNSCQLIDLHNTVWICISIRMIEYLQYINVKHVNVLSKVWLIRSQNPGEVLRWGPNTAQVRCHEGFRSREPQCQGSSEKKQPKHDRSHLKSPVAGATCRKIPLKSWIYGSQTWDSHPHSTPLQVKPNRYTCSKCSEAPKRLQSLCSPQKRTIVGRRTFPHISPYPFCQDSICFWENVSQPKTGSKISWPKWLRLGCQPSCWDRNRGSDVWEFQLLLASSHFWGNVCFCYTASPMSSYCIWMYESSVKWIRAQRRPTILLLSCHHCVPPLLCTSFGGLLNNCVALGQILKMFQ